MKEDRPIKYAPGLHVLVRDEAWRVVRVDPASAQHDALTVRGISELVRDHEAIFSTEFDKITVLDPARTQLVQDTSSHYTASRLHMESMLRRMPPVDQKIHVGHEAAMDSLDYQLEPAALALSQPRQRILIADAVGLGKTLEAGILLSELIVRKKAKRVLVVTLKSLLAQFQKEMWTRFSIPLVRLDSVALARVQRDIPTNHNPFNFFDKSIISIDTLKQPSWLEKLEKARWDVIVIDEAHNVAERGGRSHSSRRNRAARLLAKQSDSLIMLSATPHDGKAESFASLMNMLDPTAIANPHTYTRDDIKNLYVRRFKKDVLDDLRQKVPERQLFELESQASSREEAAFDALSALSFDRIDRHRSGAHLFKISIEKALLSSPAAAIATLDNRVKNYGSRKDAHEFESDIEQLEELKRTLEAIEVEDFSKYQRLLTALEKDLKWKAGKSSDRLVIFTESIPTMRWLAENLRRDLDLDEESLLTLSGEMSDIEQQHVVEEFGKKRAKVSVLVASDVASEGINLHYQSHRLVHFDIPWSLMVFQQRNGRIDRYGQEERPQIIYLSTTSANADIEADRRILQILVKKDEQVQQNIGDPSALTGKFSVEEEEAFIGEKMAEKDTSDDFLDDLFGDMSASDDGGQVDGDAKGAASGVEEELMRITAQPSERIEVRIERNHTSLFNSDFSYLEAALGALGEEGNRAIEGLELDPQSQEMSFEIPDDLRRRFRQLPAELEFKKDRLSLTFDHANMDRAIRQAWRAESSWPEIHYLWRLHPVFDWVEDRIMSIFPRHSAPILALRDGLDEGERVILASGLIPNLKSQPVLHRWYAVCFKQGEPHPTLEPFEDFLDRTRYAERTPPNRGEVQGVTSCEALLPVAVQRVREAMIEVRVAFEAQMRPKLDAQLKELELLRDRKQSAQLELFAGKNELEKQSQLREIERTFEDYKAWIKDTYKTESVPFVQIVAAFVQQ